ncbi:MAG: iron(III) transport system substrate-binding protein [Actinomycetota bacterium]|nr:iron(III) transport system substrate-binding protein [Actinomycetota bacterium]
MRSYRRIAVALVLSLVAAAASINCRGSSGDNPSTLTLYSGRHDQTTARLVAAFEKQTGLEVKVRTADEAVLANDIADAGTKRSADVFYTENTPPLRLLEIKRLLAPVSATTLAKVDYRWRSTAADWVGVSARINVMDYNTDKLQPTALPASVMDLAEPEWKGKIGIAPRDTDFHSVVTAILRTHGAERTLEWLQGIKRNAGSYVYSDNAVLSDAINRGQVELGLVNHYSWFRERAKVGPSHMRSAIAFLRPHDSGYLLDISGAAVVRSSHAPAAAQKLVAFLVSRAGAKIIAGGESYEYPLGSNVKAAKGLPAFNALQPIPLFFNDLGNGTQAVELLQQAALL